ncbi:hypothetical protein PCCS19_35790 [Paenibacillus sp. CCS19]|nr:hypothetical protein PCCS19_35790 [Paenibacillus cellulosilyticus]
MQGCRGIFRLLVFMMSAALVLTGLTGCTEDKGETAKKQVLKVMDSSELNFNLEYGDYINAAFPNVEIQVISTSDAMNYALPSSERLKRMKELIANEQPDLIMLGDDSMYKALANEGLLSDLSVYLSEDHNLEQHIHPGIVEQMKQNRDGALYALTPNLRGQLLFYNEDLFNRLGIGPPQDGMTWAEILQLAQRVTQSGSSEEEKVIGFLPAFSGPSGLASLIGMTDQLGNYPYRVSTGVMTVNMPAWQRVYRTAVESYKSGTFELGMEEDNSEQPVASYGEPGQTDLFTEGRAGMVVGSYRAYQDVPFKLGAVGAPVDEATRTRSFSMYPGFTMSLRAGSPVAQVGWDVIAFIMGDYVAKVRAGFTQDGYSDNAIPSNITYAEYAKDPIVRSIYRQMPSNVPSDYGTLSSSAYSEMAEMLNQEISNVMSDKQTFEQMIERMQEQGQEILDRELKK